MFNDFDTAEFKVGSKIRSVSRTITDGDFAAIVNNIWDTHPLHIDEEYMKTTIFGGRILSGPAIIALCSGLSNYPLMAMCRHSKLHMITALGIDNARYTAPFYPGDTLTLEIEVVSMRETRTKPGRIVGRIKDRAFKQDGQTVLEMERTYLLERDQS